MPHANITRKQAEEIFATAYDGVEIIGPLCHSMPQILRKDWDEYWDKINKAGHAYLSGYFKEDYWEMHSLDYDDFRDSVRLLTGFMFIEDTYKD